MHPLNPVRGLRGRGDPMSRTTVLHKAADGIDSISALDVPRSTTQYILEECRDAGYVDGTSYTDDGSTEVRRVQRALINHVEESFAQDGHKVTGVEDIIQQWTGFAPHPQPADIDTEPGEAVRWVNTFLHDAGVAFDDVIDIEYVADEEPDILDPQVAEWLEDRDTPFYLDDAPNGVPDEAIRHIGGGLHEVKDEY